MGESQSRDPTPGCVPEKRQHCVEGPNQRRTHKVQDYIKRSIPQRGQTHVRREQPHSAAESRQSILLYESFRGFSSHEAQRCNDMSRRIDGLAFSNFHPNRAISNFHGRRAFSNFHHNLAGEEARRPHSEQTPVMAAFFGGGNNMHERHWDDLQATPSIWWEDCEDRARKVTAWSPDLKHKRTGEEALGLGKTRTALWGRSEIETLKESLDKPWTDLFAEPSQWWDQRSRKRTSRYPDFKHKQSGEGLWLDGRRTPPWVAAKVATLRPSTLEMDVISSVERLSRYNKAGQFLKTMELFEQMQVEGITEDHYIFLHILHACAALGALEQGKRIHRKIIECGCDLNSHISTCLVDMYSKCGSLEDAREVFDKMTSRNVVAWNAFIVGCVKCGQDPQALELFRRMQRESVEPDSITFVALLNACASMVALQEGRRVHKLIVKSGCEADAFVGNSLVDMYAKCRSLEDARNVFDNMLFRDLVAWNGMILGCVNCGEPQVALELFREMQVEGVKPDSMTFVALLKACARMAALEEGRRIHEHIVKSGCEANAYVGNSLVDMYAKCGSLEDARTVFDKMPFRNVVSCNGMLTGFAMHGLGKEAVALFEEMSLSGSEINGVTFICLLSACSHGCLVKEGLHYFGRMSSVYGLTPTQQHYTIMVDILGRAGHLEDAEAMINSMPSEPSVATWLSLLASCRLHGNVEMGERAFKEVVRLDPTNSAGYVLLSNIYASAGSCESKYLVENERLRRCLTK